MQVNRMVEIKNKKTTANYYNLYATELSYTDDGNN